MEISVVIPIYNAEKTILRCLESMSLQTFRDFELIVVDNNSTDSSVKLIEGFIKETTPSPPPSEGGERGEVINIRLLHEPKQGSCAARNKGAKAAKGRIIVNTDPDCVADKNWLKDIAFAFDTPPASPPSTPPISPPFDHPLPLLLKEGKQGWSEGGNKGEVKRGEGGVGGVAGNIYGYNPRSIIEKFLSLFTLRGLGEQKIFDSYNLFTGGFATANLSVRKDVFEKIGGFDEDINIFGEDHDLCARIYKAGYKIKTVPNAVIYHIHRGDLKGFIKQCINFGIAHSVLLKKHFPEGLFLELPRFTYAKSPHPPFSKGGKGGILGMPVWINLNSFDKKIFLLFITGYFIPAALILIPLYFLYQSYDIKRRAERTGMTLSPIERLGMSGLLFIKTFFITIGSICGSLKNRVLCI